MKYTVKVPPTWEQGSYTTTAQAGYVHAGQHLSVDIAVTISQTRIAKPAEYRALQNELERIGYRLLIRRRATSADREERIRQLAR